MESIKSIRKHLTRWGYLPFYYQKDNFYQSERQCTSYEDTFLMLCEQMDETMAEDYSLWEVEVAPLGDAPQYSLDDLKVMSDDLSWGRVTKVTMHGRLLRGFIDDREVAIKTWDFIFPQLIFYPDNPSRFCTELEILIDENPHPTLLKIKGFCFDRILAIVYEENPTKFLLNELLNGRICGWNAILKVANQLASLFTWLHDKQIAFSCVNTSTIMIDEDVNIKVFDFGFLAHASEKVDSVTTAYGIYRPDAPEIGKGIRTLKSDVYTFGAVLAELVATKEDGFRLCRWIWEQYRGDIRPIMDKSLLENNVMADDFNEIVAKCLERDPNDRPDMKAVYATLSNLGEGSSSN